MLEVSSRPGYGSTFIQDTMNHALNFFKEYYVADGREKDIDTWTNALVYPGLAMPLADTLYLSKCCEVMMQCSIMILPVFMITLICDWATTMDQIDT